MKKKKKVILLVIGVVSLLTIVIGASYAYYSATVTGTGNNEGSSSITTAELPSLIYNNGENFNGINVYPGYKNIHSFTVKPQPNSKGTAVYVLHLNANVPVEFGKDIKVTVYKTIDSANNNLTRTEGVLTPVTGANGEYQYSKSDTITTNGSLEKVYENTLETNNDIILEEKQFNETLKETTYYLVYEYIETSGNQDAAQGKMFSGKVTVSLQRELSPLKPLLSDVIKNTVVTSGNGVYEVTHEDAIIGTHMNSIQTTNLKQTEYRYAGQNPNNYIIFNNELWRIIGFVNTPEGSRVKIIRNETIGYYSWDSSDTLVNEGRGINEWSQADLMKLLNPGYESETIGGSLYWNKTSGNCYSNQNNENIACNFTTTGMKEESKAKIDRITWNTGTNGTNDYTSASYGLTKHFYNYERSNNGKICSSSSNCNDTLERTTTWQGLVGLMSSTDYGYATSGGNTTNRDACLNKELFGWDNSTVNDCKTNDWLYNSASNQWTLNSYALASFANSVFNMYFSGSLNNYYALNARSVLPSIYLTLNTRVSGGEGTSSNPYIFS